MKDTAAGGIRATQGTFSSFFYDFAICVHSCCKCVLYMSLVMRKPDFCICENKDADQLCVNRTTDQRLCFRYMDSAIPLLSKSEVSCV